MLISIESELHWLMLMNPAMHYGVMYMGEDDHRILITLPGTKILKTKGMENYDTGDDQ